MENVKLREKASEKRLEAKPKELAADINTEDFHNLTPVIVSIGAYFLIICCKER